ncbi:MFS general substrate transporter [Lichtheimia hyalospora FSU 10163]|nr:MFS general substrate transporter [Lichtheimia hyalospora FSU 10163]
MAYYYRPTVGSDYGFSRQYGCHNGDAKDHIRYEKYDSLSLEPIFSKFADIFGRKCIIIIGIVMFLIGSLLCGLAQSMVWLVTARAVQGIGSGAIIPLVHIIVSDIAPLHKRALYQGIIQMFYIAGAICGPFVGGFLTDYVSWHAIFFIKYLHAKPREQGMVSIFMHIPIEKHDWRKKLGRIDYFGSILIFCASVAFSIALALGSQGTWGKPVVIVLFIMTGVFVALLCFVESRIAVEPILPPRIFVQSRTMICVIVIQFLFGAEMGAFTYYIPLFFQVVRDSSATLSGLPLIPMQIMSIFVTLFVGWLVSRTGLNKAPLVLGTMLSTTCYGLIQLFDADTPWSKIYGIILFGGIGHGCVQGLTIVTGQSTLKNQQDTAVATGMLSYTLLMGIAVGMPAGSALLNSMLIQKLVEYVPMDYATRIFNSPAYIHHGLPSQYVHGAIQAYIYSFHSLWYLVMTLAASTVVSALLIKRWSLRIQNDVTESKADV